jgi:EpsD family peptidyl-prolyl cis-trans isomerase
MLLVLSACGESASKKALTQVAAKVNGEEISIHQINVVMSHIQAASSASPEQLRRDVLDKLIDQQVLYGQAVEKKLDRDPRVMMLIDAAKREIVAQAYMDSLVQSQSKVGTTEVHEYYLANPALFSRRKLYTLEEISFPTNPEVQETLNRMVEEGKGMEEIGKYLTGKGIAFKVARGVRPAEQIPLDLLPSLALVPDGKLAVVESGKRHYVMHVVSSQASPIDEAQARQRIEIFLSNQQTQRMATQELNRLKANARIEYLGDFAKTAKEKVQGGPEAVAALKQERISE